MDQSYNWEDPFVYFAHQQALIAQEAIASQLIQNAFVEQNITNTIHAANEQASQIISDAHNFTLKIQSDATEHVANIFKNIEAEKKQKELELNALKDAISDSTNYLNEILQKALDAKNEYDETKKMLDECNLYSTLDKLNKLGLLQTGSTASLKYQMLKDQFSK